jgi:polyferredoxin
MDRIKKPRGLIRYAAQESLEKGGATRVFRPRVAVYGVVLATLLVALIATAQTRDDVEVTVLRGIGAPFELQGGLAVNQIRVKVHNRADAARRFRIELLDADGARFIAPENPLEVAANEQRSTSLFVMADPSSLPRGQRAVRFRLSDGAGYSTVVPYRLLGPQTSAVGSAP